MDAQQNLLENAYFIIKPTRRAMVRPASSDKWKAPQGNAIIYLKFPVLGATATSTGRDVMVCAILRMLLLTALPSCSRRRREPVVCLALWREREYLTFISISFVAFSNQNFEDYRS